MKEKDGQLELTWEDIRNGEALYHQLWIERGVTGGVELWFEVVERMIKQAGYKIVKDKNRNK